MASYDYVREEDVARYDSSFGFQDFLVSVLDIGIKFIVVDLRKIRMQLTAEDGSLALSDGFIKADQSLETKTVPFSMKVKDFCFVPAEFLKHVPVECTSPLGDHGFLVVYEWTDEIEESKFCNSPDVSSQDGSLSTESDVDSEDVTLDTVTFKCVGVTCDPSYQEILKIVNEQLQKGINVPVKPVPEPTNPYDSHAVSFQCQLDGSWNVIGYVIRELSDYVRDAILSENIVATKFLWVKYKVVRTTGPGFYAAIDITHKGQWPPAVCKLANSMH